jgi:hypothetical protein
MTQLPGFTLWIFRGSETDDKQWRGVMRDPNGWYVGDKPGGAIVAGPFASEARALGEARAMTDSSGT